MERDERELVLFCSGLGGAAAFWDPQLEALGKRFRVATYDQRGTGQDRSRLPEDYSIEDMADEAATLLDELGVASCHLVGHALGGLVGLEFARRHPARLSRLVVVNSWAQMDLHTERCFETRLALLDQCGVSSYIRAQAIFLYPASWASANAERLADEDLNGVSHFQGVENLCTRVAAMRAWDATTYLGDLNVELLALAAKDDVLVPWTASKRLVELCLRGRLALVPDGGHACTVANPEACNTLLLDFLTS